MIRGQFMLTITQVRVRGLSVADPDSGILVSVATCSLSIVSPGVVREGLFAIGA